MARFTDIIPLFVAFAMAVLPLTMAAPGLTRRQDEIQAYLDAHNGVRANHGATDLVWDDEVAAAAQAWANNCQFVHESDSPYGGGHFSEPHPMATVS